MSLLYNYTNIAVVDQHICATFSNICTIIIVFTIMICYGTIVIVVKFDYRLALLWTKGVDKLCIADLTLCMIKGSFDFITYVIVTKVYEVIVSI